MNTSRNYDGKKVKRYRRNGAGKKSRIRLVYFRLELASKLTFDCDIVLVILSFFITGVLLIFSIFDS